MSNKSVVRVYIYIKIINELQLAREFPYYTYAYDAFQKVMNNNTDDLHNCLPLTKENIFAIEDVLEDYKEYHLMEIKELKDKKEIILKMNNSIEEKLKALEYINNSIKYFNSEIEDIQSTLEFYRKIYCPSIYEIYGGIDGNAPTLCYKGGIKNE